MRLLREEENQKKDQEMLYQLVFQHKDFLVINKPAGLAVHPPENKFSKSPDFSGTLAGQLLKDFPQIINVGEKDFRPGIVHRLDKETSGLMLVALNQSSFIFFKSAFSQRKVEKKYWALVWGQPKREKGKIRSLIGRSRNCPTKQTAVFSPSKAKNPRPAESDYFFCRNFGTFSLLEVIPKTGRKHQIRLHLHLLGVPIVGDKKYQTKALREKNKLFSRHFLHAFSLRFIYVDGKEYFFCDSWPKDFRHLTGEDF